MTFNLNKDERYIFASDLDGTLLAPLSSLHIDTYEMIEKIKEAGHYFVITTGRSWWWTKTLYEQIGIVDASIHFSGAIVHHPHDNKFEEFRSSLSQVVLKDFFEKMDIWSFANRTTAVGRKYHATWSKGDDLNKLFFNCYEYIVNFSDDKMTSDEFIAKATEVLGEGYVIRVWNLSEYGGGHSAIISPKNTNKAAGLEKVAEYYNVQRENVIYFGDNVNDIEALEWAGHSYAVANAKDVAKESADEILELDNNTGAVPKKIIELINKAE